MSQSSSSASSRRAQVGGAGEVEQALPLAPVRHDRLEVQALRVGDRPFGLGEPDQHRAGLLKEPGGEVAHVPQPLHHHPLALDAGREAERLHVLGDAAHLPHAVEDAPAGGLDPPADAARAHRLRGDAAERVHLPGAELAVGVGDPGHFPRTGADVGRGDVEARADEVLADQLEHVAPGDPLQLSRRVGPGIEPDAALGPAERDVHQRALVGHERGERLHLLGVHGVGVADAALAGELVVAVLRPPRVHDLDAAVVALDGEAGVEEVLARLDVGEEGGIVRRECGRAIERSIHLVEKARTDGHG